MWSGRGKSVWSFAVRRLPIKLARRLSCIREPLLLCLTKWFPDLDGPTLVDVLRVLVVEGQYDPMEKGGSEELTIMHSYFADLDGYQWLLDQNEFHIDFAQKTWIGFDVCDSISTTYDDDTSDLLEAILMRDLDRSARKGPFRIANWTTLHSLALLASGFFQCRDFPDRISLLLNYNGDLPFGKGSRPSMLDALLFDPCRGDSPEVAKRHFDGQIDWRLDLHGRSPFKNTRLLPNATLAELNYFQYALDEWVRVLLEARADLKAYFHHEQDCHPENMFHLGTWTALLSFQYGEGAEPFRIRVVALHVCRKENAPTSSVDSTLEGYRHLSATMPGTWTVDHED